jgi:hypothetical protein
LLLAVVVVAARLLEVFRAAVAAVLVGIALLLDLQAVEHLLRLPLLCLWEVLIQLQLVLAVVALVVQGDLMAALLYLQL